MEISGTTDNGIPQTSTKRKLWVLGLVVIGFITLAVSLASVALFVFVYIHRTIATTSSTIPLFADEPAQNQIAFVGNDDNVWLVSPDGTELRSITNDGRGYQFPTWAPDGLRLAFIGPNEKNAPSLYISPTGSSDPVIVFNRRQSAPFYLYWAPDSNSITFLTQETSGLAMRQVDTRAPDANRTLAQGTPFYWVWSPESDKMLLHVGGSQAASDKAHISLLENHKDAERIQLDLAPGGFQAPVWSSDGNHIFYIAANNEGGESIYKTDAKTLEQTLVSDLDEFAYMVLSPDNQHIAYLQLEGKLPPPFGQAYLVDTDGNNHKPLMETPVASMYWSPDGTKLALLGLKLADDGPTAQRINGLAAPLPQEETLLRWWIYNVETEELEPLVSFHPTPSFLQTVPYFDQYHLSLTFWSPDSRYFVITKDDSHKGAAVWVVDTAGEDKPRQVGEGTLAVWSWQ